MKSANTFKYDKFIEAVIKKYGFESRQTLMFVRLVELTNDSTKVMMIILCIKINTRIPLDGQGRVWYTVGTKKEKERIEQ